LSQEEHSLLVLKLQDILFMLKVNPPPTLSLQVWWRLSSITGILSVQVKVQSLSNGCVVPWSFTFQHTLWELMEQTPSLFQVVDEELNSALLNPLTFATQLQETQYYTLAEVI
jgi:hypothetical protein